MFLASPPIEMHTYIFHTSPLIAVGVDFILNLVVIELPLTIWTLIVVMFYLLINFIFTKYILVYPNTPVYPIMTWSTWQGSLRDFFLYSALGLIVHIVVWLICWLKLFLLLGEKPKNKDKSLPSSFTDYSDDTHIMVFLI